MQSNLVSISSAFTRDDVHECWSHYVDGKLHRIDGPAIIYDNGTIKWYQNGKRHREDGPAFEYYNGMKYWYYNDQLHRLDGPAVEFPNYKKTWYYYGKEIPCSSQKEFEKLINLKAFW